ncbi:MAG: hemin-degrading factor [Cereibacter sp.]|jgi:putative hemin transport protein|nr:hemin-degrading factor [Cereibacter sp.]
MAERFSPSHIRALRAEDPRARARDFAEARGLTEADLVAAHVGHGATAIAAEPDLLMPLIGDLGDVLALTRNDHCVHEQRGTYSDFHGGGHAAMVLGAEIDLRIFPAHWRHAFALDEGDRRSLQIFDAQGAAVHKVHLTPESDVAAFGRLVAALALPEQREDLRLSPRLPVEPAKADPARAPQLRQEWEAMTDTHQFLKLTRKLKMNRLGAYRIVGAPQARLLAPEAVTRGLEAAAAQAVPLMIFVGNPGCIQIHGGPIERIVPMGPWINVMDPRFNLHLRADRIAEVWAVAKPTQRGMAISVEAFDAAGGLILQIFGQRTEAGLDSWNGLVAGLPALQAVPA